MLPCTDFTGTSCCFQGYFLIHQVQLNFCPFHYSHITVVCLRQKDNSVRRKNPIRLLSWHRGDTSSCSYLLLSVNWPEYSTVAASTMQQCIDCPSIPPSLVCSYVQTHTHTRVHVHNHTLYLPLSYFHTLPPSFYYPGPEISSEEVQRTKAVVLTSNMEVIWRVSLSG